MDKIIYSKTVLDCGPARAFEAFTVNELLETWLAEEADVEPVVGGKYELFWNPENRDIDSTIGCKVTAVEPGKFIAFEWRGPAQYRDFMNAADPLTHVAVSFIPDGDKTEVHLFHSGWRSAPEWEEARQWFVKAWEHGFNQLKERVKAG
ncbi:MAG: SRPBCC domain-containing protein, partial [Candidatus Coatesbacteria bacterium]